MNKEEKENKEIKAKEKFQQIYTKKVNRRITIKNPGDAVSFMFM